MVRRYDLSPRLSRYSSFHSLEPVLLALPKRGKDMQPTRVTQRCHKQVRPNTLAADPHPRVAKVDLHLTSRRRLKPNCRALQGRRSVAIAIRGRNDAYARRRRSGEADATSGCNRPAWGGPWPM